MAPASNRAGESAGAELSEIDFLERAIGAQAACLWGTRAARPYGLRSRRGGQSNDMGNTLF